MVAIKMPPWLAEKKADRWIRSIGFSFYDDYSLFKEIVDSYEWGMCQIQYNYANEETQAGTKRIEYASTNDLPVVIMEPHLGGLLVKPPAKIHSLIDAAENHPVDMAQRRFWNRKEVTVVLSGIGTEKELDANVRSAETAKADSLSQGERAFIRNVQYALLSSSSIPYTRCGDCSPCPNGVNIPRNFELYNENSRFKDSQLSKALFNGLFTVLGEADRCTSCEICETRWSPGYPYT